MPNPTMSSGDDSKRRDDGDAASQRTHNSSFSNVVPRSDPDSPDTVRHVPTSEARRSYGSVEPRVHAPSAGSLSRTQSETPSYFRETVTSPTHLGQSSAQILAKPKRPTGMRRMSSSRRSLPHRDMEFSVDDDPSEIEEDRTPVPPLTPQRPSFTSISRQGSTVRRRLAHQVIPLPRVDSQGEEEEEEDLQEQQDPREEVVPEVEESPVADKDLEDDDGDEDVDDELSDAESFTLKDRQTAINQTHPFGIRIWKPALYRKNRSVEKGADDDIHSSPSQIVSGWLWVFNCLWTLLFGWWLALAATVAALVCFIAGFECSARKYGKIFWSLAGYLFFPFGQFVRLEQDENYAEEDEGEGRSISEYERWQSGDLEYGRLMFGPTQTHTGSIVGRRRSSIESANERDSLLGRTPRGEALDAPNDLNGPTARKRRLFGRGQWTLGRVIFFVFFYFLIAPLLVFASGVCWLMVFWIPMGRVTLILFYQLRKRPLALSFHPDITYARSSTKPSSILLCTYRAAGLKYWKYTVDGTNIFLINFLAIVVFVIFDYFVLKEALDLHIWLTSPALLFTLALVSIIPLAYFIGQAVASISAQSSMGMGAAINAFFSTIVEVYLYCIALNEGKGKLVEGSVIGSIFAGILLLPGMSMCFGAIKRKTQRFNQKSAGATTAMLLFATIAAFTPTLFYKIYGAHELICRTCTTQDPDMPRDCRQCYFRQVPAINDDFFTEAVRPYCWFAAVLLFSSYIIGLLFTLRTHAKVIWETDDEKKPAVQAIMTADVSPTDTRHQSSMNGPNALSGGQGLSSARSTMIRDSQLYKRILGQSLRQAGLQSISADAIPENDSRTVSHPGSIKHGVEPSAKPSLPHVVPPKTSEGTGMKSPQLKPLSGLSEEENHSLFRQVAEMAATAATVAARDAVQHPKSTSYQANHIQSNSSTLKQRPTVTRTNTVLEQSLTLAPGDTNLQPPQGEIAGGHDAPNWSRTKSAVILLVATIAYAIVAEVLVNTVDVVLDSVDIDEKFLGITLFALVPNTTEFLNAISFAMNGNIALSMEIGSAYALQVCLLQIPALVLFSAVHGQFIDPGDLIDHTFQLIFPQWDMVTVILCVFLLSYMYGEGKSNYFKGSILVLTYLVVLMGFYYSGYTSMDVLGIDPDDTLSIMSSYALATRSGAGRSGGVARRGREL